MIRRSFALVLTCISIVLSGTSGEPRGTLTLEFTGIHTSKGSIAIGMNRSPDGWPRNPDLEYHWNKTHLQNGTLVVTIRELPYGTYAISALDDENNDREMDMTLGIPREGWGFSNNPPFKLSTPKFSDCSFRFSPSETFVRIKMNYAGKKR